MPLVLDGPIYTAFVTQKEYSDDSKDCVESTVAKLLQTTTTADRPGMLLGKIQSGKTRTFLGVMALAFDNGYEVVIVFTKGTVALAQQTLERLKAEFKTLTENDQVQIFDIMHFPANLTEYELNQKLIIVCKKEDDNIRRLDEALFQLYGDLSTRRVLIIDDEADFASVGFRRTKDEGIKINKIASQIDTLRKKLAAADFLQVTATPYSLYLQPEDMKLSSGTDPLMPARPAFTELVPIHSKYVGGEYYFEESQAPDSIASHLHYEVGPTELRALQKADGRVFKLSDALTSPAIRSLRYAIVTFIVGGCIRRLQDKRTGHPKKFSFIVHTERSRRAHEWQEQVVRTVVQQLQAIRTSNPDMLRSLILASYDDLSRSVRMMDFYLPSLQETVDEVHSHLHTVMITRVNSENDIKQLLDDTGQLRLRTPLNIFIGGQILDRGLTIANLIGFYYGRNPNKFQQDTVLQHSRMYGLRPKEDLTVTRFYTTAAIYSVMQTIHDFDSSLRRAFETGGHEAGVIFLRTDSGNRIVPCSPNKILLSSTTTLRPRKRLLPVGFQTKGKSATLPAVRRIDELLSPFEEGIDAGRAFLIGLDLAKDIVDSIEDTLEFDETSLGWDVRAFKAAMVYLSRSNAEEAQREKLWCLVRRPRDVSRVREGGRYQNAPDTKQEQDLANSLDPNTPLLMLFRQKGSKEQGWNDCPFWWPVLQAPRNTKTVIFASEMND